MGLGEAAIKSNQYDFRKKMTKLSVNRSGASQGGTPFVRCGARTQAALAAAAEHNSGFICRSRALS
jgi:hypothetical protein